MTREIKFRAWDTDNKEMSEVFKLIHEHELFDDQHIVMQFTGLHDKNGKEIYEGDILHFKTRGGNNMTYMVTWRGTGFKPTRMSEHNRNEFEIIGNIYQSPELIKE